MFKKLSLNSHNAKLLSAIAQEYKVPLTSVFISGIESKEGAPLDGFVKTTIRNEPSQFSSACSTKEYKQGTVVRSFPITEADYQDQHANHWQTFQAGVHSDGSALNVYDPLVVLMNNHCAPSCVIGFHQGDAGLVDRIDVIAHRDLKPGDELNFCYPSTESRIVADIECWCSAHPDRTPKLLGHFEPRTQFISLEQIRLDQTRTVPWKSLSPSFKDGYANAFDRDFPNAAKVLRCYQESFRSVHS